MTAKTYLISGMANKKSVAYFTAKSIMQTHSEANLIFTAQNEKNLAQIKKYFPNSHSFILDVENKEHLANMAKELKKATNEIDGFLHSIAFAKMPLTPQAFHETPREDFLQACQISCFSLVEMTNAIKDLLTEKSSIVTVSISNTRATSYGYMGPIKAMLGAAVCYLAKSMSYKNIRVNSVGAGPLKTSASAGIPGYIENYLFAEALTMRKEALKTTEIAETIKFLLSDISSGINAQNIIVDAGMNSNYFDQDIVKKFNN